MTLKLSLSCYCLVFTVFPIAKQYNNKTRTAWESYWRQLNGCFTVFPIAKQNNNKTRTVWVSYWRQLNGCFTVFPIAKFSCLQYDTQAVLVLLLFCFAIGNTVKQPFNCLQYDTQTVLVLLLLCFAIGKTIERLLYRISNSKTKQ
jgi:hypothetical protein